MKIKWPSLTTQIFVGLFAGIAIGWIYPQVGLTIEPGAEVFLRMVKTIIAPLIFATLVVGIAGGGHVSSVGRLGLKCMIYFEVVTTFALAIGLLLVNTVHPGFGVNLTSGNEAELATLAAKQPNISDIVTHIFPSSVIDSMARGDVLQIVVFTMLFAVAVSATKATMIVQFCEQLSSVMFKYTGYVMKFAPVGVACAMAATVGHHGVSVLVSLGKLVGTLYLALFVFIAVVLLPIAFFARIPLKKFAQAVKEPMLIAFFDHQQ
ncbi:MAG: cation:dicarboxylase symporter family transporter [Candidatus Obscuribacterales bacterium]